MNIGPIELIILMIIGILCLCLIGGMATIVGGVVLLKRRSQKKGQAAVELTSDQTADEGVGGEGI